MGKFKNSPATEFAYAACKAFVGLEPRYGEPLSDSSQAELIAMALKAKASGFALSGIRKGGLPASDSIIDSLSEAVRRNLIRNLASLAQASRAAAILQDAGIEVLVIKGPTRTHDVFSALDMRGSGDADLLVRQKDYRRAGEALCRAGFVRGVPENSTWWHDYLGESPFLPEDGGTVVDLHHKIQQPGGPAPKELDLFFKCRAKSALTNPPVFVPSTTCALAIAYLEFSKTIRAGDPWIANVVEITISKAKLSDHENAEFSEVIARLELLRLIQDLDSRIAKLLADEENSDVQNALINSAFNGSGHKGRRFHRSRLQWEWSQHSGARRILHFVDSVRFRVWSDVVRWIDN